MANLKDGRKSFADKIRKNVQVLREESQREKEILGRILGAAAQLAENNEKLISEASDAALDALED